MVLGALDVIMADKNGDKLTNYTCQQSRKDRVGGVLRNRKMDLFGKFIASIENTVYYSIYKK